MVNFARCARGYTKTKKECTDLRDEGYSKCTGWGENCTTWAKKCVVDWIPIIGPAICKVFEWICTLTEWICKASVWVASMVCHAWKLVNVFVCVVWEAAGAVLFIVGTIVKTILAIPVVGAIIKQALNWVTGSVLGILGFVAEGFLCGIFRVCLTKNVRVCVMIARTGGAPAATPAQLQPFIDRATQIYREQANINLIVSVDDDAQAPQVDVADCDFAGWVQDFGLPGTSYEFTAGLHCREWSFGSVVGLGSPIYAIAVREVKGSTNGCSLGWLTNYVVFEGIPATCSGFTTLAHEMGHCMGLMRHDYDDPANLMFPSCQNPGRDQISQLQKAILRGSKYATYF
jgi:hypothetical protein